LGRKLKLYKTVFTSCCCGSTAAAICCYI